MGDTELLFHSPESLSEEELATIRTRFSVARIYPLAFAGIFGAAFYATTAIVLKRHLYWQLIGASAVAGYASGASYLDSYYYEHYTFKGAFDLQTQRQTDNSNSHIVDDSHSVVTALGSRWLKYALTNNLLMKEHYSVLDGTPIKKAY